MKIAIRPVLHVAIASVAALVVTVALHSAGRGTASPNASFAAAFNCEFVVTEIDEKGIHISVVGDGAGSLLGDATCETTNQVVNKEGYGSATYTLQSPRGSLTLQCEGEPRCSYKSRGIETGGTYAVTDGTGFFHGARGKGVFSASIEFARSEIGIDYEPMTGIGRLALFGVLEFAPPEE